MARPNKGLDHVDGLQGDREQKQRLRCILSTLFGLKSVAEACAELAIGATYFGMLRTLVLQACLDALAPRRVGRPPLVPSEVKQEMEALRRRVAELERENQLLRTQLELAALSALRENRRPKSPRGARQ